MAVYCVDCKWIQPRTFWDHLFGTGKEFRHCLCPSHRYYSGWDRNADYVDRDRTNRWGWCSIENKRGECKDFAKRADGTRLLSTQDIG